MKVRLRNVLRRKSEYGRGWPPASRWCLAARRSGVQVPYPPLHQGLAKTASPFFIDGPLKRLGSIKGCHPLARWSFTLAATIHGPNFFPPPPDCIVAAKGSDRAILAAETCLSLLAGRCFLSTLAKGLGEDENLVAQPSDQASRFVRSITAIRSPQPRGVRNEFGPCSAVHDDVSAVLRLGFVGG